MKRKTCAKVFVLLATALLFNSCEREPPCPCWDDSPAVKVFATGLNSPRGLEFGPDGMLYVAEAGIGGTDSTVNVCPDLQVAFPAGPFVGSPIGGRISKINHGGVRTTLTDRLPSSKENDAIGGNMQGVADIAFIGHTMYALLAGAGCGHGVASVPNGVVKVNPDGTWSTFVNLSKWLPYHPVANPGPDYDPEGTPYSMISVGDALYVLEPNHGDFIKITSNGNVIRVADISASQGHIVPTAVDHLDDFIFGNLNVFPIVQGSSSLYKIKPGGNVEVLATGFTTVVGLAHDNSRRLYVLENTTGNLFPTPNTGRVVRLNADGSREVIASGLNLPTGMTFGPDGKLYVSTVGFGPEATGGGEVVQIKVDKCACNGWHMDTPAK